MQPNVNVSMLIRASAEKVFNAFVDPAMLTRFWLAKASGPLEEEGSVTWEFKVPGAIADIRVREIVQDRRLVLDWEGRRTAELCFQQRPDGFTRIELNSLSMGQTADEAVANAIEATQGYTLVIANLKVLLETGTSAGLVEDKAMLISEKHASKI